MVGKRKSRRRRGTEPEGELVDQGVSQLLDSLPPERREAVRRAAQHTPRLVLTQGAFHTKLSEETQEAEHETTTSA